jgi:hypothetical protein
MRSLNVTVWILAVLASSCTTLQPSLATWGEEIYRQDAASAKTSSPATGDQANTAQLLSQASSDDIKTIANDPKVRGEVESQKFAGISWGVGPSLTIDWGKHDRVEDASLDPTGKVRVDDVNNSIPRLTLETHYFFDISGDETQGLGPFVAIQASGDELIEAIGFGIMYGIRRSRESATSFNLGLGVMVDPNVKVLGDGIKENQTLPPGETAIRFREEEQWGLLFISSFSF